MTLKNGYRKGTYFLPPFVLVILLNIYHSSHVPGHVVLKFYSAGSTKSGHLPFKGISIRNWKMVDEISLLHAKGILPWS